ncbi:MAG: helix-turn-helix domain-containing protein [Pyrinomonadaceae bacterium]|nr:helix-turn-helix domain-containing protein [Pyrinomonadaceae bacterium]
MEKNMPVEMVTVPKLMTLEQLVEWLQVQKATVYGWVHRRQIPFIKVGPKELMHGGARERDSRPLRFDYHEILEWLETGTMPDRFKR